MFTGLITEIGQVAGRRSAGKTVRLTIAAGKTAPRLGPGDSVAVAGACLTVESVSGDSFACAVIPETLATTRLGRLHVGDSVNLELPLGPNDRFDGHLVAGHVDTIGQAKRVEKVGRGGRISISFAREYDRWIVDKGSIAVDGISLTIAGRRPGEVVMGIIPATWEETTIGRVKPGDLVNIEFDQTIKAVRQAAAAGDCPAALSEERLRQAGW